MTDNAQLYELTKVLAVELTARTGELWRADIDPDNWITHLRTDTAHIGLKLDTWHKPARLTTWEATPKGITALPTQHEMSVNPDRTPASIAADIDRRLLPYARDYLIKCRESQDAHDRQERKEKLIKNLLSRYLPQRGYNDTLHARGIRAELRTSYIDLHIDATPTEALKIARLLQELRKGEGNQ